MGETVKKVDWRKGLSLIGQQEYLFKSGIQSDCDISVGEREVVGLNSYIAQEMFGAHKLMLFRASSIFETMCFGNNSSGENQKNKKLQIRIKDIEPNIFSYLLRYIYTDILPDSLSIEELMSLCLAASNYLIYNLHQACVNKLKLQLNLKTFWPIYQFVSEENHTSEDLALAAEQFLRQNTQQLIQESSMLDVSKVCILNLTKQDKLNINSELILIRACLLWSTAQCNKNNIIVDYHNLRTILGTEIISNMRFLSLDGSEFVLGLGQEGWLMPEEKNEILTYFVMPNYEIQNPNLCKIKESRRISLKRKSISDENEIVYKNKNNTEFTLSACKDSRYIYKSESFTCEFLIKFNANILLQKLIFCGQSNNTSIVNKLATNFSIDKNAKQYDEQINIEIQSEIDIKGAKTIMKLVNITFNEIVDYDHTFPIKLPDNVKLNKDQTYKVIITCGRIGCYYIRWFHDKAIFRTPYVETCIMRNVNKGIVALPLHGISFLSQ